MSKPISSIPLYNKFPDHIVNIDFVDSLMNLRMKMLDAIDQSQDRSNKELMIKSMILNNSQINWSNDQSIVNDNLSFFMIAFAFCKNEIQRAWLANLEAKLYVKRIETFGIVKDEVFKLMNIPLEEVNHVDENLIKKIKFKYVPSQNKQKQEAAPIHNQIYRIPFEFVLNLIPTMNYYIHKGYVYINDADRLSIIETVFRENTLRKYNNISKSYETIISDRRIHSLINNLEAKRELNRIGDTNDRKNKEMSSVCSLKDIEDHAEKNFPLCMQIVHKTLTKESHLKHNGRLQYGLFLKGLGLSLDESLTFWRNKFSMKTTLDKFEKDYAYSIRHNYGLEGKRSNYPPWSCNKIQGLSMPNSTEMHGCPYKIFSEDKLRSLLYDLKMKELDVMKIMDKKKSNEYSICCIRQFEAKFPDLNYEKVGVHPNYYFESATKHLKNKDKSSNKIVPEYDEELPPDI